MINIVITFIVSSLIIGLLYYFFVHTCEKDGNKKFNYSNFRCENIVNSTPGPTLSQYVTPSSTPFTTPFTTPHSTPHSTPFISSG